VSAAYDSINAVLARAVGKRNEYKNAFKGMKKVNDMSDAERDALFTQLEQIREEYEARQAAVDEKLAAFRASLTTEQQRLFDALPKPRVVPSTPRPPRNPERKIKRP
jgi:hypothetical protein